MTKLRGNGDEWASENFDIQIVFDLSDFVLKQ